MNKSNSKHAEQVTEETYDYYIPTYVVNLPERTDRRKHIEQQFEGKPEFQLNIIEGVKSKTGNMGLWQGIVKAVKMAKEHQDDIIIICEDDHTFTPHYNKELFIRNIIEAGEQGVELLSAGIGGFGTAVRVSEYRYWFDWFWCMQCIVVYKPLFDRIINYEFKESDTTDGTLSILTPHKMTIYPFFSVQSDFGYSDVTRSNNEVPGLIVQHFRNSEARLSVIKRISDYYR